MRDDVWSISGPFIGYIAHLDNPNKLAQGEQAIRVQSFQRIVC